MKNKFKTLKLFSGAAVMATLCFMASGVGATRVAEDNNIHDVAYYERRFEEASAACRRLGKLCTADSEWGKSEDHRTEIADTYSGCADAYQAMLRAQPSKLNNYDVKNSKIVGFFKEMGVKGREERIAIMTETAKAVGLTFTREERRRHILMYKILDEIWDVVQPLMYINLTNLIHDQD